MKAQICCEPYSHGGLSTSTLLCSQSIFKRLLEFMQQQIRDVGVEGEGQNFWSSCSPSSPNTEEKKPLKVYRIYSLIATGIITTDTCVVVKISVLNCKSLKYPLKRVVFLVVSCEFSSNKKLRGFFFLFLTNVSQKSLAKLVSQFPNHSLRLYIASSWEMRFGNDRPRLLTTTFCECGNESLTAITLMAVRYHPLGEKAAIWV